ncbi:MAG: cyclic nucleotide-binding domain-containing protein, partial [Gammaproteobacteria bacterium]
LIDGEVALQSEGLVIEVVSSAHESSKFALAHQLPRKIDAVARGMVRFLRVDAGRINTHQQTECGEDDAIEVEEEMSESGSDDWMTAFLKVPIFQRLPPANLQKILISLEEVAAEKGEVIIEQGAAGDYYYFLKSGQCLVSRRPSPGAKEIRLGLLEKGETFGEDALIMAAPRAVSITAMTDASLLRLNKKQFVDLIKSPSLAFIDYEDLPSLQREGAILLDIRPQDEYVGGHLDGSVNMPFFSLRMQCKNLNREKTVIVVCRDGRESEAGAFFLLKQKFKAVILKGGMESVPEEIWPGTVQSAPADLGEAINEKPSTAGHENTFTLQEEPCVGMEELLQQLRAENDALKRKVVQLSEKCNKLSMEKKQIEDRFMTLSRHFEQLRQKLKNTAG